MFYVGQKVVALVSRSSEGREVLVKDSIYTITKVFNCSCGQQIVSWGSKHSIKEAVNNCHNCWHIFEKHDEYTASSERFAPLETYRESYSIAIELVQQMEQVDKQKIFNPKKETV